MLNSWKNLDLSEWKLKIKPLFLSSVASLVFSDWDSWRVGTNNHGQYQRSQGAMYETVSAWERENAYGLLTFDLQFKLLR